MPGDKMQSVLFYNVLPLVLSLLLVLGQHTVSGDSKFACSGGRNNTLDIQCGPGYMLHILRSFYGYSVSGQCQLVKEEEQDGCTKDDDVKNYDYCVGRPECVINLPSGVHGVNIKRCGGKPSNYFQVDYKCVQENLVHDICKENRLLGESGYIRTPRYPNNYAQQGQCNISVIASPSQKIRLYIIDLQLRENGHTHCFDHIYFRDSLRSITLCGVRRNNSYTMESSLHIEVSSTSRGLSRGFWLYYEAHPPLRNTLQPPTLPRNNDNDNNDNENNKNNNLLNNDNKHSNTQNHANTDSNKHTDGSLEQRNGESPSKGDNQENNENTTPAFANKGNTVPLIRNKTNGSSNNLPFAAIAGGVIGTLSLILVILLLLLLVKWLNERRYYKAEKILEIRNPAFRSSGDFYEQQQPNNSNYYW